MRIFPGCSNNVCYTVVSASVDKQSLRRFPDFSISVSIHSRRHDLHSREAQPPHEAALCAQKTNRRVMSYLLDR